MDEYFDVIGYEGLYKITKSGDIFGCKSKKILKYSLDKDGYSVLKLRKDNKPKKCSKHRLLALQFIPNDDPINKKEVDHIDRNNNNNSLENLRWVTRSINSKNRKRFGIVRENISIDKRRGNNTKRINFIASYNYYDENGETIKLKIKLLYPIIV